MTRSLTIALLALFIKVTFSQNSPSEILNSFCPCSARNQCTQVFGNSDEDVFKDILNAIPECPVLQVRCCTKEVMFTALMTIINGHGGQEPALTFQTRPLSP